MPRVPLPLASLLWAGSLCAQSPAPAVPGAATSPAPAPIQSRLETLDATYKANLRRLHAPVLQDYVRELELLRQQLAARGRLADAKSVETEIEATKQLILAGGVMSYASLQQQTSAPGGDTPTPPPDSAPPRPGPGTTPPEQPPLGRSLVLQPSTARLPGTAAVPTAKTVSPGVVEWTVPSLPAGVYDLSMVFAAATLEKDVELHVAFAGREVKDTLRADRATGSTEAFRILRLGRLTLDRDVTNELLQLRASLPAGTLLVKNLIFSEPRRPRAN